MLRTAPDPLDVQDLQFKLRCRIKAFDNVNNKNFSRHCSLVACASRFGLIFIGTNSSSIQAIQLKNIEEYTKTDGDKVDYPRRIFPLVSPPTHLSVNCEHTVLAIVVEKNNCSCALFYDVKSFWRHDIVQLGEVRLSPTPAVYVVDVNWNPTLASVFTACKSDGTLGIYEVKNPGIDINELPAVAGATCFCWSPKGKQIAVGSRDGKITQYKPDLKAVKVINAPPLKEPHSLQTLQWVSNYQFIGVFQPMHADGQASFIVIDAPKTGDPIYTNYDDICYSNGNTRPVQFYTILLQNWNVLMAASSNSMEVGILGNAGECWTQWIMGDASRAELPLGSNHQETLPIGCELDIGSTQPLQWGESTLPPVPLLLLLSNQGMLCCFNVINLKEGIPSICTPPEVVKDTSGLYHFVSGSSQFKNDQGNLVKEVNKAKPQEISQVQPNVEMSQGLNLSKTQPLNLFGGQATLTPVLPINKITSQSTQQSLHQAVPASIESKSASGVSISQTSTPVNSISSPAATKTVVTSTVTPNNVPKSDPNELNKSDIINMDLKAEEEAEKIFAQMLKEECIFLESELKAVLHQGRTLKLNLGTDADKTKIVQTTQALESFFNELVDICTTQNAEIHTLKQNLLQSWAWYEEVKSRHIASQDESMMILVRAQPLDSASEKQLEDIRHTNYYLESQIAQAHLALDEQWENFQDYCKKTHKLHIPTMEMIFQTMVKQNAILRKQGYILKDIANRIRTKSRSAFAPSLLISMDDTKDLPDELKRLRMNPEDICQIQYEHVVNRMKNFTEKKSDTLRSFLKKRDYSRISAVKPQLSTSIIQASPSTKLKQLSSLATQTPSILKEHSPRNLNFLQSTPKPKLEPPSSEIQSSTPIEGLQNFTIKFEAKNFSNMTDKTFSPLTKNIIAGSPNSAFVSTSLGSNVSSSASPTITFKPTFLSASSTTATSTVCPNNSTKSFFFGNSGGAASAQGTTASTSLGSNVSSSASPIITFKPTFLSASSTTVTSTVSPNNSTKSFPFGNSGGAASSQGTTASISLGSNVSSSVSPIISFKPTFLSASSTTATSTVSPTNSTKSLSFGNSGAAGSSQGAAGTNMPKSTASSFVSTNVLTSSLAKPSWSFQPTSVSITSSPGPVEVKSISTTSIFDTNSKSSSAIPNFSITSKSTPESTKTAVTTSLIFGSATSTTAPFSPSSATTTSSFFGTAGHKPTETGSVVSKPFSFSPKPSTPVSATTQASFSIFNPVPPSHTNIGVTTTAVVNLSKGTAVSATISSPLNIPKINQVASTSTVPPSSSPFTSTQILSSGAFTSSSTAQDSLVSNSVTPISTQSSAFSMGGIKSSVSTSPIPLLPISSVVTSALTGGVISTAVAVTATSTTTTSVVGTSLPVSTTTTLSIFGSATYTSTQPSAVPPIHSTTGLIFGGTSTTKPSTFSSSDATGSKPSLFGGVPSTTSTKTAFGSSVTSSTTEASIFSGTSTSSTPGFGATATTTIQSSIFGGVSSTSVTTGFATPVASTSALLTFGSAPSTCSTTDFGATTLSTKQSLVFSAGTTNQTSVFGAAVTSAPPQSSIFGTPASTTPPSQAFGIFGDASSKSSVFGSAVPTTHAQSSIFGSNNQSTIFGNTTTSASAGFGQSQSVFDTSKNTPSVFGQSTGFGSSGSTFGSTNVFGPSATSFGQTTGSIFGGTVTTATGSIFGATPTTSSAFGSSASVFGSPAATTPSLFGSGSAFSSTATQQNSFATSTSASAFGFGNLNVGSTTTSSSGFGTASNPFGGENKNIFGGSSVPANSSGFGSSGNSIFGSNASQNFGGGFGNQNQSVFGQQSNFGQNSFGGSGFGQQPSGPFSAGSSGTVAQSGFGGVTTFQKPGGFGASPVFGSSPAFGSSPSFGGAPSFGSPSQFGTASKPFGTGSPGFAAAPATTQNTAFGNLANQPTVGFGNLAQQASAPSPSAPFSGNSSFSSWR
jgi:nuclear pore complex protein Nup214